MIGVVALELVAQVPVREQHHVLGEEAAAVIGEEVPHHDIVRGNVVLAAAEYLGVTGLDCCRHPGGESVSHAGVGPFEAAPVLSEGVLLLKGVEREVEDGDECRLVGEEVVRQVRIGVKCSEDVVYPGELRAGQMQRSLQPHGHLVGCAVKGLECRRQFVEQHLAVFGRSSVTFGGELFELRFSAVLSPPQCCRLGHALLHQCLVSLRTFFHDGLLINIVAAASMTVGIRFIILRRV